MASKRRATGKAMSMPAGIALGIGVSMVMTVIGAMVLAWLIVTERVGENAIGYGCMIILPLASALGNIAAWNAIRHRRMMVCGICSAGYYVALLAVALIFGGQYEGLGLTALLVALGGGITLIPGIIGNRSGAKRHKIPAYR